MLPPLPFSSPGHVVAPRSLGEALLAWTFDTLPFLVVVLAARDAGNRAESGPSYASGYGVLNWTP